MPNILRPQKQKNRRIYRMSKTKIEEFTDCQKQKNRRIRRMSKTKKSKNLQFVKYHHEGLILTLVSSIYCSILAMVSSSSSTSTFSSCISTLGSFLVVFFPRFGVDIFLCGIFYFWRNTLKKLIRMITFRNFIFNLKSFCYLLNCRLISCSPDCNYTALDQGSVLNHQLIQLKWLTERVCKRNFKWPPRKDCSTRLIKNELDLKPNNNIGIPASALENRKHKRSVQTL